MKGCAGSAARHIHFGNKKCSQNRKLTKFSHLVVIVDEEYHSKLVRGELIRHPLDQPHNLCVRSR